MTRRLRQARAPVRIGTMPHLVRCAAEAAKVPDTVARRVVDGFLAAVKAATWELGRVVVPGFVTLNVRHRKARMSFGAMDPAADVVKVRAAKAWRER